MISHEWREPGAAPGDAAWPLLSARLDEAAADVPVGEAPVGAIISGARRQTRLRAVGASALGLAVGVAVVAGAPLGPGSGPEPPGYTNEYGTSVVASGTVGGADWKLVRVLRAQTLAEWRTMKAECDKPGWHEELFVETADGVRTPATGTVDMCGGKPGLEGPPPWHHQFPHGVPWDGPVPIGTAGVVMMGQFDEHKIAKVVFKPSDGGPDQVATVIKAKWPENGSYFFIPLASKDSAAGAAQIVFYDAAGHVVQP